MQLLQIAQAWNHLAADAECIEGLSEKARGMGLLPLKDQMN
ncbi:MAG: hypothetical protein ACRD9W_17985 [Terriglobia bacterium]